MEFMLSTKTALPSSVVAYIHTYLGMIRQQQKHYDAAIDAFVKALFIRRSANQPLVLIAVTCYRLGIAYRLNNDIDNAMLHLKQAIQYYSKAETISMDHQFVVAAQNSLFELKQGEGSSSARFSQSNTFRKSFKDEGTVSTSELTEGGWNNNPPFAIRR